MTATLPHTRFRLPAGREAAEPIEASGRARDEVALLVARPDGRTHTSMRHLGLHLRPGDLVVVNTSATLPAALDAHHDGRAVVVHLATRHDDGRWTVELRHPDGHGPVLDAHPAAPVLLDAGGTAMLLAPDGRAGDGVRLWRARLELPSPVHEHLDRHGRPITYGHVDRRFPLEAYQTVFARHPGSAEMPSAGRPFTPRLVTDLVTRGIGVAPITLHTGVSSLEAHEPPRPERYDVPEHTARLVTDTRRRGGRVVAVGTTVTRALETVADEQGTVRAGRGWTDLVLGPDQPARVVDGLVTGWHEPGASHLLLLEAVAGPELVAAAYAAAVGGPYLWHEFGDSCLLLP